MIPSKRTTKIQLAIIQSANFRFGSDQMANIKYPNFFDEALGFPKRYVHDTEHAIFTKNIHYTDRY